MTENNLTMDERLRRPSASNIERLVYCPASFKRSLEYGIKEEKSFAAEKGTKIHDALSGKLSMELLSEQERRIALKIGDMVNTLTQKLFISNDFNSDRFIVIREERIWYSKTWIFNDDIPTQLFSAKPDLAIYDNDSNDLLIVEYKTGASYVERPYYNYQLRAQAAAITQYLTENFAKKINLVYLAVAQPEASNSPILATANTETVRKWAYDIECAIEEAESPNPYVMPGKVCGFCQAFNTCPEASAFAVLALPRSQRPHIDLSDISPKIWVEQYLMEWNNMPVNVKIDKITLLDVASKMYEGVKNYIREELKRNPAAYGNVIKLAPGSAKRVIKPQDVFKLADQLGLNQDEILSAFNVIIGELELAYSRKQQELNNEPVTKTSSSKYKTKFNEIVLPYTTIVESEPRLVMNLYSKNKSLTVETKPIS